MTISTPNKHTFVNTESDLSRWQNDWANYHVVLTMAQLGLFDLLADGQSRSAERLAAELHADTRAIDICGRILAETGLLTYIEGKFNLTQTAQQLSIPLRELKWQWKRRQNYCQLLDTILSGQPVLVTSGGVLEEDETDTREFLTMLYRHSTGGVRASVNLLRKLQSRQPHIQHWQVLDLGGGHGRYAAAFAAELPDTQATLFDRPVALHVAHELSGGKFALCGGDFLQDDLGGPYDIVFMSYVVSGLSTDNMRTLFRRLRGIIRPGGFLVIQDMFVDPVTRLSPGTAIDFQLTLLLENQAGLFRTAPEIYDLLAEANFCSRQTQSVEGQEFSFVIGS